MEKKKLLLVAISVGVFLVIAIGAAILVFGSGNNAGGMVSTRPIPPGSLVNAAIAFPAEQIQPVLPNEEDNPVQVSANNPDITVNSANENNIESGAVNSGSAYGNGSANGSGSAAAVSSAVSNYQDPPKDSSTVISVTRPSTAAVPDVPPSNRQVPAAQNPARTTAAASASAPPASAPKTGTVQTAASTAARPVPRTYDDFWVQTGSFTTVAGAEGVKNTLTEKGIASIIENRVLDGTTYYRVRVGPYTSRNEADYWLSLIKSIKGFEDSQIWQSQSTR